LAAAPALLLGGCQQVGLAPNEVDENAVRETEGPREAVRVVVQHVLIAHEDAGIPGVTRSIEQAGALAGVVLVKAKAGEDFDELVQLYGDDRDSGGVYAVTNFGASATPDEVERVTLVRGFGDLAFKLEPGGIGLVKYDKVKSPHGFHVIKRLR
jgi:hypothetical protein